MAILTGPGGVEITDAVPASSAFGQVVRVVGPLGPIVPDATDLQNGNETVVGAVAILILAASPNPSRVAIIQNTGAVNIRVGVAGVTATTGLRYVPDQIVIYEDCDDELWAIREGAVDGLVFAQEAA